MITLMNTKKMSDRSVIACPLGISSYATGLHATGLSAGSALLPVMPVRLPSERPTQAPAVAVAAAEARTYAFAAAANGAGAGTAEGATAANGRALSDQARNDRAFNGQALNEYAFNGQQKTQHGTKWAFRGLEPWSDPA